MAIVMGRLKNKENISLPIIWERDTKRKVSKGFTTASKTTQHFVNRYSALIELKRYAPRWTKTRRKISPIEWRKMSTFDTKRIGGSLSIHLEKLDRWEIVQTSMKRWPRLHRESGKERLAPTSWQYQKWHPSSSSSITSWWQWNDFWWSLMKILRKKSTSELVKEQQKERVDPLCNFFTKLLRSGTLQDFFVVVRSFTADSSLLQPTECVNSTPHTSHFSQCCTTNDTHMRGSSRMFGVRASHSMRHLHALMLCVWFSSTSPLSSLCCLSTLLSSCLSSWHQLHLPRCGGQIPCALQPMRTLALLPSTTLRWHKCQVSVRTVHDSTYWVVHSAAVGTSAPYTARCNFGCEANPLGISPTWHKKWQLEENGNCSRHRAESHQLRVRSPKKCWQHWF